MFSTDAKIQNVHFKINRTYKDILHIYNKFYPLRLCINENIFKMITCQKN